MVSFGKSSIPISPRFKVALVPLLTGALIIQLWPGRDSPSGPDTNTENELATGKSGLEIGTESHDTRKWPDAHFDATLRHNPFHSSILQPPLAEQVPTPSRTEAVSTIANSAPAKSEVLRLENRRVSAVLISPQGPSAIIDS